MPIICFNSIFVRLKANKAVFSRRGVVKFQFNFCAIKRWKIYLNSHIQIRFNSIFVRLKDAQEELTIETTMFQFNFCAIKSI